ncbi:MAG: hypothetical protein K2Q33_03590 [Gammaproteobacteria bacterium]|nr:hypothetical protein [Gammaproteobacteria bacterium]
MIKINAMALLLLTSLLLGCSVEGKNDFGSYYQKQASLELLKMPPGVQAEGVDNYYTVPPGPMADVKTVSILPPGSRAFESAIARQQAKAADKSPAVVTSNAADAAKPVEELPAATVNTTGNS